MIHNLASLPREATVNTTFDPATGVATVTADATAYVSEWVDLAGLAGQWVAFAVDAAPVVGATVLRITSAFVGGSTTNTSQNVELSTAGRQSVVRQIPADATSIRFYTWLYRGFITSLVTPSIGDAARLTRWSIAVAPTEADALDAVATYRDGNTPGWAWDGAPGVSTSRGPAEPYAPEAQLSGGGARAAWLDVVTELETRAEAATVVHAPLVGGIAPHYTVRAAGPRTTTLRLVFGRELADGTPAQRSRAAELALAAGGVHRIEYLVGELASSWLDVVPTGALVRADVPATRSRGARTVWTLEAECTVVGSSS